MSSSFQISVIIPTYNREKLVSRAIESVLNQSFQPEEIIVIDDGSTDGTKELITSKFPRTQYIWQENSGISSARNEGIKQSKGNWIAFLDSDDEWLPNKLESQVNALKENEDFKICHTNEIWIRDGRRVNPKNIHKKFGGYIFDKCLPLCVISPSSVLIKKEIFDEFGLFDTSLPACEDYDMWLRICAFIPVLYLEETLLVKYGGHQDQLSKKYWGMDRFRILALEKAVNNNKISKSSREQALQVLIEKLSIFINGAKKRRRLEIVNEYEKKIEDYSKFLND